MAYDDLPSVASEASSDDRYKAIKDGAESDDAPEGDTVSDCIDRAVAAAKDGDWGAFGTAMKEAFSDYGAE